jgi:hypothetical protein
MEEAAMKFLTTKDWPAFGDMVIPAASILEAQKGDKLFFYGRPVPMPPPVDSVQCLDKDATKFMLEFYGYGAERRRLRVAPGAEL